MEAERYVSLDEIAEYYSVANQTFTKEEDFFEFYNSYAYHKGFSVRKDRVRYKPGTDEGFVDAHTHALAKQEHAFVLRSHLGLNDPQKAEAVELGLGGRRPFQ
ncbi:hypothetical protein BAE44_0006087, partial [Dichanthelium oligosanthes]